MLFDKLKGGLQAQRFSYFLLCILIFVAIFSGCSSSKSNSTEPLAVNPQTAPAVMQDSKALVESKSESISQSDQSNSAGQQTVPSGETATTMNVAPPAGENGFNRKLIYTANMVMQVKDYAKAQTELRDLVAGSGGYILNFNESETKTEIGGTYTIKIAANGFVSLLDSIETINKAKQRSVQGQDVTEEYVDLSSRLKAKELVEQRLLNFMAQATKSDDLLAFSQELGRVQEEIEQLKGRMRYLDQNVAFSTIELRMYQLIETKVLDDPDDKSFYSKIKDALNYSLQLLVTIVQGIIIIFTVILPFLLIACLFGIPIWYFIRKRKGKGKVENKP
jgi:Domain of unknown function (DUF4349)